MIFAIRFETHTMATGVHALSCSAKTSKYAVTVEVEAASASEAAARFADEARGLPMPKICRCCGNT